LAAAGAWISDYMLLVVCYSRIEGERGCRGEEEDGVGEEQSSDEGLIQFRSSVVRYIARRFLLHLFIYYSHSAPEYSLLGFAWRLGRRAASSGSVVDGPGRMVLT